MTLCVWQARSSRPLADHITPLRQTQNPPMPQCRYGPCLPASHPHARYMSTSAQLSLSFPLLQLRNNQIERQMCYWLAYVQLVNTCTSMLTVRGTCRHASSCSLHFPRCTLLRRRRVMQMLSLLCRVRRCGLLPVGNPTLQLAIHLVTHPPQGTCDDGTCHAGLQI